jgi:hypothetical protein
MDWSALVGALIGAGVPASLAAGTALHQLRRGGQSRDAEAFGPALLLLDRLDPDRVSFNVSRDPEVENPKWALLGEQADRARERLLVVAAGHPRKKVRDLAGVAEVELGNALAHSGWQAHDMARGQGDPDWRRTAKETHAQAEAALRALIDENFRRRPW